MILTCLEIIQDYGLRSIGLGERVLPKTDITICHQATLIGSGMLWNIYFGVLALILGFFFAILLSLGRRSDHHIVSYLCDTFILIFRGTPLFIQFFFAFDTIFKTQWFFALLDFSDFFFHKPQQLVLFMNFCQKISYLLKLHIYQNLKQNNIKIIQW